MKKKNNTKNNKNNIKKRDFNILLHIKGEINLNTRSESKPKKYSRKVKHKKDF